MADLTLSFLGSFQVKLDDRAIIDFRYEKVRLLLIYLVMTAVDPQSREKLAVLLWPNRSEARSNLRKALSTLRQVLGEEMSSFLLPTRNTIQFNPQSSYSLDVEVFTAHLHACTLHSHPSESCLDCMARLQQAITTYRGSFLEQVSPPESEAFEEWVTLTRARLHRQAVTACTLLTQSFEQQQNWEQAQIHAQRLLELEPTLETAHQSLMRILAQQGQRTAALQQFDRCCQMLKADLGTEPLAATIALFEQIRAGAQLHSAAVPASDAISLPEPFEEDALISDQGVLRQSASVKLDHGGAQALRNRSKMLDKVYSFWIQGVLENSLHHAILIDLGLEDRPNAVAQPWNLLIQPLNPPQPAQPLETHILDAYEKFEGTLLILGDPGAGKTTMLLELARSLIDQAKQDLDHPIPVVFNLSSWAAQPQSIEQWLVNELQTRYQIPQRIGQAWIEKAEILPLLDGLDEVVLEQRPACVEAINQFQLQNWLNPLVVCSRTADYEALGDRLQLQGAIVVQSMQPTQVDAYFDCLGNQVAKTALAQNPFLQELVNTPLMASIMAIAYEQIPVQSLDSINQWRNHLFDSYIQRMLIHRGQDQRYAPEQVTAWLQWLANHLFQRSQTAFFIEQLQPNWLLNTDQRLLSISEIFAVGLLFGLAGGLGAGVQSGLATGWADGIIPWLQSGLWGMLYGLGIGVLSGIVVSMAIGGLTLLTDREPIATEAEQPRSIGYAARLGSAAAAQGIAIGLVFEPKLGIFYALATSVAVGIGVWRLFRPGQITLVEMWGWSWSCLKQGILPGLMLGAMFGFGNWLNYGSVAGWIVGLSVGVITLVSFGLRGAEIEAKTVPNQGIHNSARNAMTMSLAIGLPLGLAHAIGYGFSLNWAGGIGYGISAGALGCAAFWLRCGGLACIQHSLVRYLLFRSGVVPWNYAHFLDHAADRILLRKVGGGYIFIHRLLLEHFALRNRTELPKQ